MKSNRHPARSRRVYDDCNVDSAITLRFTQNDELSCFVQNGEGGIKPMNKQAFVYILASQKNGTLYTGVTSDLIKRIYEHKIKAHEKSFTAKYEIDKLVWYIMGDSIEGAIALEKKIKNRNRAWKINLIEKQNPDWHDLSADFMDSTTSLRFVQNDDGVEQCHPCVPYRHPAQSRRVYNNEIDKII